MTANQPVLIEEIDLRPYIAALLRRWYLILGVTVGAGLLALAVSALLPPTYEATALVAVTEPRFNLRFDPRFEAFEDVQTAYAAYPALALSDDLIAQLFEALEPTDIGTPFALKERLQVQTAADPSLWRLSAQLDDAEEAALTANRWSELFVQRANEVYGNQGEAALRFLEAQLQTAEADLDRTQEALIDFQTRNRAAILRNELNDVTQTQAKTLAQRRNRDNLGRDLRAFLALLQSQPTTTPVSMAEQLTLIALQTRAFDTAAALTNVQLQLAPDSALITSLSRADLTDSVNDLLLVLEQQTATLETLLVDLESQILDTQTALQLLEQEENNLVKQQTLAQDTHDTLARTVEETRISSQDTVNDQVRLVSQAAVPPEPIAPQQLLILLAAVGGGFLFSIIAILGQQWFEQV